MLESVITTHEHPLIVLNNLSFPLLQLLGSSPRVKISVEIVTASSYVILIFTSRPTQVLLMSTTSSMITVIS